MRSWSEAFAVQPLALPRRFALSLVAIALASVLLRGWIAMGLVSRGDDLLRAGNQDRALVFYARAAWFAPAWDAPTDRFAFAASLTGDRVLMRRAIALTTALLAREPASDIVRWDRAMCLLHLGRKDVAFADLAALARAKRSDWRMNDMAWQVARALGRPQAAAEFAPYARRR